MTDTSSSSARHADTGNGATRTAVVLPWENPAGHQPRGADARLAEMVELAKSIGLGVVHTAVVPLRARRPSTLLGQGQVASLGQAVAEHSTELAVVDAALSPVQQRNLEREWCGIQGMSAPDSDLISAGDSEVKSAIPI